MFSSLQSALSQWASVVGDSHVVTASEALAASGTATFHTEQKVAAIVRPADAEQVRACVIIANEFQTPIYPLSTGKNWGYGSSVPPRSGCVILDLSRLNSIVDFDESLAYVTVEPGVTQRQLFEFLQEQGGRLWMDATGSSPDCSIIGNTLERGFGHTPYGDHFAHACGMEVVLPTGERVRTGFGQFSNAVAAPVYQWGLGPYLDGLFTQSNLGVVTRMTVWLMPKPDFFQAFNFNVDRDSQLERLLEGLRQLRLEGTIRSAVHIGDSYKVLSSIRQYPWHETGGAVPLSEAVLARFKKRQRIGAWSGSGGLYGTRKQVHAARKRIKQVLSPRTGQLKFLTDRTLSWAPHVARPYRALTGLDLGELLKLLRPAYGLLKGEPTDAFLASTYWRKKMTVPRDMDPDRDGCGLIWCTPVAPNDPDRVRQMISTVHTILADYPFEPAMSLTMINERSLENVISIAYDRDVPGEDERAMDASAAILAGLADQGYYPYRTGVQQAAVFARSSPEYRDLMARMKRVFDPHNILSPGRFIAGGS